MSYLVGKHVVITRATHQASTLETLLRQHQAIPILYPCIAIVPPADTTQLDTQLIHLESFDWLILTSTNTVHALKERLNTLDLHPDWTQLKIAVVGGKTAHAFHNQFACDVNFIPNTFTAESLAQTLPINRHDRIFVPQSVLADNTLTEILYRRGAEVICMTAYETVVGHGGEDVPAMLQRGEIDALTFTSSSTVENFVRRIHPLPLPDVPALCIGSSTADTARRIEFKQIIVPDSDYTLQGMIDTLTHYYESSSIKHT
jgi:uroporphyrinogen-III synthase